MTRRLHTRLRPPWTLLACAVALIALLGVEWTQFAAPRAAVPAAPRAAPSDGAVPQRASFTPPPPERYDEVSARPLFLPNRLPPKQAESIKPPLSPPAFTIQGVVLSPERRSAIIEHGNPPKLDSVSEGATIDGWRIESIDRDRVSLRAGAATAEIPVGIPGRHPTPRSPIPIRRGGLAADED